MTKKQVIEAMKDLDDDAQVHIYCTSSEMGGGEYTHDVYFDDKVTGDELENEITLVAHF